MATHYSHTQVGWVMVGALAVALALCVPLLPLGDVPLPARIAIGGVAVILLLFTTLTVEVDEREVRLRYTVGLIHRRVPIAEVRRCRALRNSWIHGWGIRRLRNGWMWNVSGLDAVELEWHDGSIFRIGTDEPQALARAIQQVVPAAGDGAATDTPDPERRGGPRTAIIAGLLVLVGSVAFVTPFFLQTRPPKVTVTADAFTVDALFYGETWPLTEVTGLELLDEIPPASRTNGFAGGGVLSGRFQVRGLGAGKLFVDLGNAPYLLVRLRHGFVIVNFKDADKTRALYDELQRAYGALAVSS